MALNSVQMIQGTENAIQYTFQDKNIIWEALQALDSGYRFAGWREITTKGHKRLALVGDRDRHGVESSATCSSTASPHTVLTISTPLTILLT